MAPEHRFETAARLTREVVTAFCEGGLSLQVGSALENHMLHLRSPNWFCRAQA